VPKKSLKCLLLFIDHLFSLRIVKVT